MVGVTDLPPLCHEGYSGTGCCLFSHLPTCQRICPSEGGGEAPWAISSQDKGPQPPGPGPSPALPHSTPAAGRGRGDGRLRAMLDVASSPGTGDPWVTLHLLQDSWAWAVPSKAARKPPVSESCPPGRGSDTSLSHDPGHRLSLVALYPVTQVRPPSVVWPVFTFQNFLYTFPGSNFSCFSQ